MIGRAYPLTQTGKRKQKSSQTEAITSICEDFVAPTGIEPVYHA